MKREGGLVLCTCGHAKAYHFDRPLWFRGPMTGSDTCAFCTCKSYQMGDDQRLSFKQDWQIGEARTYERVKIRDADGRHVGDDWRCVGRQGGSDEAHVE